MIAKDSFIILQSGTELTGALCRVGLKSREVSYLHHVTCADLTPQAVASGLRSLLDGFEWDRGYSARYGLVHVGGGSMARTPNTSAYLYKDIAASGGIRKGALARYCPDWDPPEGLDLS